MSFKPQIKSSGPLIADCQIKIRELQDKLRIEEKNEKDLTAEQALLKKKDKKQQKQIKELEEEIKKLDEILAQRNQDIQQIQDDIKEEEEVAKKIMEQKEQEVDEEEQKKLNKMSEIEALINESSNIINTKQKEHDEKRHQKFLRTMQAQEQEEEEQQQQQQQQQQQPVKVDWKGSAKKAKEVIHQQNEQEQV